ncbi:MAG: response regulator [FCB group bacterium]|nr:response regulator [FCB group bacterium]
MADKRAKILIVEDDLSSQQYYSFVFRGKHEITMVSTIAEAKKALVEQTYEIALIDFSLPGGESGLDLIKYLQQEYPGKTVALALTAHAFPQNKEEVLAAGAVEFLTKPIMSKALLEVIAKYDPYTPENLP